MFRGRGIPIMTMRARSFRKSWLAVPLGLGLWMSAGTASAACLAKAGPAAGPMQPLIIMLAPASQLAEYVSLGFHQIACPSDWSDLRAYVDRICSGSGDGPAPALNTDALIGRPRAYACTSARAGLAESGG
jgi:hypothetical protein